MNISVFMNAHKDDHVKVDIVSRWQSRIIKNEMHTKGRDGAEDYIARFGRGMKAAKAIGFAIHADNEGFSEFSARMWEEAFYLETGQRVTAESKPNQIAGNTADMIIIDAPLAPKPFPHYPQLLVAVDEPTALTISKGSNIGIQEKIDGERVMVSMTDGVVVAGNKRSLVRPLPLNVIEQLQQLGEGKDYVLDCELVGTRLHVFDMIEFGGSGVLKELPYKSRYECLEQMYDQAGIEDDSTITIVGLVTDPEHKLEFIEALREENKEGFVMKNLDAEYVAGEKHGTQWKFQFRTTNACIAGKQKKSKAAVEVFVVRPDGSNRSMGYVTIPPNHEIPTEGSIVEIQNLYTHPGVYGKFSQAVYKGIRDDALDTDCREDKLHVKGSQ